MPPNKRMQATHQSIIQFVSENWMTLWSQWTGSLLDFIGKKGSGALLSKTGSNQILFACNLLKSYARHSDPELRSPGLADAVQDPR